MSITGLSVDPEHVGIRDEEGSVKCFLNTSENKSQNSEVGGRSGSKDPQLVGHSSFSTAASDLQRQREAKQI